MSPNDLRLHANEIMHQLYLLKESQQLEILRAYAVACLEMLDKEEERK